MTEFFILSFILCCHQVAPVDLGCLILRVCSAVWEPERPLLEPKWAKQGGDRTVESAVSFAV